MIKLDIHHKSRFMTLSGDPVDIAIFATSLPSTVTKTPSSPSKSSMIADSEPHKSVPGSSALSSRHLQPHGKHSKNPSRSMSPGLKITDMLSPSLPIDDTIENRPNGPRHGLVAPSSSLPRAPATTSTTSLVNGALDLLGSTPTPSIPTRQPSLAPTPSLSTLPYSTSTPTSSPAMLGSTIKGIFGFRNSGNSCYINATLQALLALPSFISDLGSPQLSRLVPDAGVETLYRALLAAMDRTLQQKRKQVMDPSRVKLAVARLHEKFRDTRQQDAHEFFVSCLDQLESELAHGGLNSARKQQLEEVKAKSLPQKRSLRRKRRLIEEEDDNEPDTPLNSSAMDIGEDMDVPYSERATLLCPSKRNFIGVIRATMTCIACKDISYNDETFRFITLDVFKDLQAMIDTVITNCKGSSEEPLEKEAEMREKLECDFHWPPTLENLLYVTLSKTRLERSCEKCRHKECFIERGFVQLPRVLVIQLKCFGYNQLTNTSSKLNAVIDVDTEVNLKKFCFRDAVSGPVTFTPNMEETMEKSKERYEKLENEEAEYAAYLKKKRDVNISKKRSYSSITPFAERSATSKQLQHTSTHSTILASSTRVSLGAASSAAGPWAKPATGLHDERSSAYTDRLETALNEDTSTSQEVDDIMKAVLKKPKYSETTTTREVISVDGATMELDGDETFEIDLEMAASASDRKAGTSFGDEVEEVLKYGPGDLPDAFDDAFQTQSVRSNGLGGLKGGAPPKVDYIDDVSDDELITKDDSETLVKDDAEPLDLDGMSPRTKNMWTLAHKVAMGDISADTLRHCPQSPLPKLELPHRSVTPASSNSITSTTSSSVAPRNPISTKSFIPPRSNQLSTISVDDDDTDEMKRALKESLQDHQTHEQNEAAFKSLLESTKPVSSAKPITSTRHNFDCKDLFAEGEMDGDHKPSEFNGDEKAPIITYKPGKTPASVSSDPPRPPISYDYKLQSVIHHLGASVSSGHYVADVRVSKDTMADIKASETMARSESGGGQADEWLHFDDDRVSHSSSDALKRAPYLLFYVNSAIICT